MRPLNDWDVAYLDELAGQKETANFERKASDGLTKEKIAQGVCAFANSGEGYMVFGFRDEKAGGGMDEGVPATKGRQPIEDWAEALIPTLHQPPIEGCEARFIRHPAHHQPDRGVLVIAVPLSERRPHWTRDDEKAYLRAGAISAPMRPQTLLDISSRGTVPRGSVVELVIAPFRDRTYRKVGRLTLTVDFWACLEGGPITEQWAVELRVRPEDSRFQYAKVEMASNGPHLNPLPDLVSPFEVHETGVAFIRGSGPLFPHRWTKVLPQDAALLLHVPETKTSLEVAATFFAASALPATKLFGFDIQEGIPVLRPAQES